MIATGVTMLFALAAVIGLIYLLAFVYKKRQVGSGLMNIVQYLPLGPKKGMAAVKIGSEVMIIGISPNDFKLLRIYNEKSLEKVDFNKMIKESAPPVSPPKSAQPGLEPKR